MMQEDCSRRVFLRKFALFSAGSLMLGATTMACYGPGAIDKRPLLSPAVRGMFFIDAAAHTVPLQNSQNVPVNVKFTIEFSVAMNTALAATVALTDHNDAAVPFGNAWGSDFIVNVVSSSNLLFNTQYRLRVLDAESKQGEKTILDVNADATFRTVAS